MDPLTLTLIITVAAVLVVIGTLWASYNGLVADRNRVREAFSGVYVQLKRRADLIPNLVSVVKGYAAHEREVFENVTKARSAFLELNAEDRTAVMAQGNLLTAGLGRLLAVAESYPDLKASQSFLKLQEELKETEDQIAAARRIYNSNVNDYNNSVQQFPSNLVAKRFGFVSEAFFETEKSVETAPQVSFS